MIGEDAPGPRSSESISPLFRSTAADDAGPMRRNGNVRGVLVQFDRPDWRPLISLLGERLAESFMWVHEIRLDDETTIHAYKHVDTRRYLHLSSSGTAYRYLDDSVYSPVTVVEAVLRVAPSCDRALLGAEQMAELAGLRLHG